METAAPYIPNYLGNPIQPYGSEPYFGYNIWLASLRRHARLVGMWDDIDPEAYDRGSDLCREVTLPDMQNIPGLRAHATDHGMMTYKESWDVLVEYTRLRAAQSNERTNQFRLMNYWISQCIDLEEYDGIVESLVSISNENPKKFSTRQLVREVQWRYGPAKQAPERREREALRPERVGAEDISW